MSESLFRPKANLVTMAFQCVTSALWIASIASLQAFYSHWFRFDSFRFVSLRPFYKCPSRSAFFMEHCVCHSVASTTLSKKHDHTTGDAVSLYDHSAAQVCLGYTNTHSLRGIPTFQQKYYTNIADNFVWNGKVVSHLEKVAQPIRKVDLDSEVCSSNCVNQDTIIKFTN
jgi:hypothetical protein